MAAGQSRASFVFEEANSNLTHNSVIIYPVSLKSASANEFLSESDEMYEY